MIVSVSTYEQIRFSLGQDKEVTPSHKARILAFLRNGLEKEEKPPEPEKLPWIVPRWQVSELLGRSVRTVDMLCKQGLLDKKVFPGRKEAAGITRESLLRMLDRLEPVKEENTQAKKELFKRDGKIARARKAKAKGRKAVKV